MLGTLKIHNKEFAGYVKSGMCAGMFTGACSVTVLYFLNGWMPICIGEKPRRIKTNLNRNTVGLCGRVFVRYQGCGPLMPQEILYTLVSSL